MMNTLHLSHPSNDGVYELLKDCHIVSDIEKIRHWVETYDPQEDLEDDDLGAMKVTLTELETYLKRGRELGLSDEEISTIVTLAMEAS